MQAEDGLNKTRDAGGQAPELAEESPGSEGGDGLLDEGPDLGVGPVDGLLACGKAVPTAAVRSADRTVGTLVALVRPAGDACLGESISERFQRGYRSGDRGGMGSECATDRAPCR